MAKDVKVIISLSKPTGRIGFGIPLILTTKATDAVPYTECNNIDEVKALFDDSAAVYKAAQLLFMQDNAPAKIAVCASLDKATDAIDKLCNKGWRQLVIIGLNDADKPGESTLEEVGACLEAKQDKMLFCHVGDVSELANLKAYSRIFAMVYANEEDDFYPEAAVVGATAGKEVGSITYKNMILKGVEPLELTSAELDAIHAEGGCTVIEKAGDIVTSEGVVCSGEYADIIDAQDWLIQQIEYRTQRTLNMNDKVRYDNRGIAQLEAVCVTVLKEGYANGMIADDENGKPDYTVDYGKREETDPNDRLERRYTLGRFRFALAGAIHSAGINGEIEI